MRLLLLDQMHLGNYMYMSNHTETYMYEHMQEQSDVACKFAWPSSIHTPAKHVTQLHRMPFDCAGLCRRVVTHHAACRFDAIPFFSTL